MAVHAPLPVLPAVPAAAAAEIVIFLLHHRKKADIRAAALPVFFLLGVFLAGRAETGSEAFREFGSSPHVIYSGLTGEVREVRDSAYGIRALLRDCTLSRDGVDYSCGGVWAETRKSVRIGDQIVVTGWLSPIETAGNPGQFDYRAYCLQQGIEFAFEAESMQVLSTGGAPLRRAFAGMRETLKTSLAKTDTLSDGALPALLFGGSSGMEEELRRIYQQNGLMHLFSISGLHIGLVGEGLYRMLKKRSRTVSCAAAMAGVLFYGALTGFPLSACRAVIMAGVRRGSSFSKRSYDGLSALALAALVILMMRPLALFSFSFLLSFTACAGIEVLVPALTRFLRPKRRAYTSLVFSLGIFWSLRPILLRQTGAYSFWNLFFTPFLSPVLPVMMASAAAACAAGLVSLPLARYAAWPGGILAKGITAVGEALRKVPFCGWIVGAPDGVSLCAEYLLLIAAVVVMRRMSRGDGQPGRRGVFTLIMGTALLIILMPAGIRGSEAVFLDVGQGDGIALHFEAEGTFLIDGGSSSVRNVGEDRLIPYLKYRGVSSVEGVFLTHADADHINGILELLADDEIRVRQIYVPSVSLDGEKWAELKQLAAEKGVPVNGLSAGDVLTGSGWQLRCLYPAGESTDHMTDENETSLVLEFTQGAFRALLMGDLPESREDELLSYDRADLLKVGHHGSASSTGEAFLMRIRPVYAVLSYGRNNPYGHPSPKAVQRLRTCGAEVYSTAECGALTFTVKADGSYRIRAFRGLP